jgi:lipoate-protein ligase B
LVSSPAAPPAARIEWRFCGLVRWRDADREMRALADARRRGDAPNTLLLLEHPSVITLGTRTPAHDVLAPPDELARAGIELERADRGGRATYHGPGQLVGYPVVHVGRSPAAGPMLARALGDAMLDLARALGVDEARWDDDAPGVYVGRDKLGAVGVRVDHGVSRHGFAFNLSPDLSHYRFLVACGHTDRGVTSIARIRGSAPAAGELAPLAASLVAARLTPCLSDRFLN